MVAEGLSKQPMDTISKHIVDMGFNCVRLTWPLYLATNDSLASLTVRRSFQKLGLLEAIAGIQSNNPSIVDLPLIKAYQVALSTIPTDDQLINTFASEKSQIFYFDHFLFLVFIIILCETSDIKTLTT